MKAFRFLTATALTGAAITAVPAFAQVATAPAQVDCATDPNGTGCKPVNADGSAADNGVITVTGSRIKSPNLESAAPISAVTGEELFETGRVSVGDTLN